MANTLGVEGMSKKSIHSSKNHDQPYHSMHSAYIDGIVLYPTSWSKHVYGLLNMITSSVLMAQTLVHTVSTRGSIV